MVMNVHLWPCSCKIWLVLPPDQIYDKRNW